MMLIHTNRTGQSSLLLHRPGPQLELDRGHRVRYEAAGSLVTLSSSPTELIFKEGDNKIVQKMVMDILPVLSSSNLEVRRLGAAKERRLFSVSGNPKDTCRSANLKSLIHSEEAFFQQIWKLKRDEI